MPTWIKTSQTLGTFVVTRFIRIPSLDHIKELEILEPGMTMIGFCFSKNHKFKFLRGKSEES